MQDFGNKEFSYLRDEDTGLIRGLPEVMEVEPLRSMVEGDV